MKQISIICLAAIFLQACANEADLNDLESFTMAKADAQDVDIQPLPTIKPTEFFQYTAADKTSPFSLTNISPKKPTGLEVDPVLPDQDRIRQALEYFALDALEMVGSLKQNERTYALISAPDTTVHRISKNEFMGTNLGKVIEITDGEVVLEETVKTGRGQWEKRNISITLNE